MADFWKKRREKAAKKQQEKEQKLLEKRLALLKIGKLKRKGRIGLCLGGGGARGFAHIGVLRAFTEAGLTFDYCSGTSVGSLIGALYCGGVSPDKMQEFGDALQMKDIHSKNLLFPGSTDGIGKVIVDLLGEKGFPDLKPTFCAVATDLVTAKEAWLTDGDLAKSVEASCCVPLLFKPVELDGRTFVDGGLTNNIPADVCRVAGGCEYVVIVDVNPTRGEGTEKKNSFAVAKATLSIALAQSAYKGYQNADIIVAPNLSAFRSYSKAGHQEMIALGYEAGKKAVVEIVNALYL